MKRDNGYYKVIKRNSEKWEIAYYEYGYWKRIGTDIDYTDFDFKSINNKKIDI